MSDYVFVTGGSGFIGTAVVAQLVLDKDHKSYDKVICLVRNDQEAEKVKMLGAEPLFGSLSDVSRHDPWKQIAAHAAYVIHCVQPPFQSDEYELQRITLDKSLLKALQSAPVLKRVIFCFCSSYFGSSEKNVDEKMSPRAPIGIGRYFEESVNLLRASNLNYAAAFIGSVYGFGSWFTEMYLNALHNKEPIYVCNPAPIWPYIHVEDVARGLEYLLTVTDEKLQEVGREIILADDNPTTTLDFVQKLAHYINIKPFIHIEDRIAVDVALGPLAEYLCSSMNHSNKRLKQLGFQLKYPTVDDGLKSAFVVSPP